MEQIQYCDVLDRKTFLRNHLKPRKPIVVRKALQSWYEQGAWTFEAFGEAFRDVVVPLRVPDETAVAGYEHKFDTVGKYVEKLCEGQRVEECGYLTRVPLPPQLEQAAVFPDFRWIDKFARTRAWIGPAGTVSMLHCDLIDNLFAQIKGRKRWQLFDYDSIERAGPRQGNSLLPHPRYREQLPEPDYDFVMEEGDLLYLPPYQWHLVSSLDPSISITHVWYTPRTTCRDALRLSLAFARGAVRKLRGRRRLRAG